MLITSCVAFSMAKDGVSKILSSRWRSIWEPSVSSFPFLLPLIMKLDAFTRSPAKGNKSIVLLTLNTVWKIEISTLLIVDDANTGFSLKMIYITIPKITAPTVLNRRWMLRRLIGSDAGDQRRHTRADILSQRDEDGGLPVHDSV